MVSQRSGQSGLIPSPGMQFAAVILNSGDQVAAGFPADFPRTETPVEFR
jgi:hypothetical protein